MKWRTFEIKRQPGFRLNLTDLLFLALLAGLAMLLHRLAPATGLHWLPLYLGLSFFLFCNVFRIGNRLEIFWYVPFTLLAGQALYTMNLEIFWYTALPLLELIKWGLIGYRIRKGPYVGLGHQRLARYAVQPRQ